MNDLRLIGTPAFPLRASGLTNLVRCHWRAAVMHLNLASDTSGIAAQTGSLLHAGVAAWHENNRDYIKACEAMRAALALFPDADYDDAEPMLYGYASDERNVYADIIACEQKIAFTLPPHPTDPTQAEIVIQGTLDQLRYHNGMLRVYDVKSSKRYGYELMNEHTLQIAAYAYGAGKMLDKRVEPGSLILTRNYVKRQPTEAYQEFPWTFDDIPLILESVQSAVARLRGGEITISPGDYCRYCPAQGIDFCIPMLQELRSANRG